VVDGSNSSFREEEVGVIELDMVLPLGDFLGVLGDSGSSRTLIEDELRVMPSKDLGVAGPGIHVFPVLLDVRSSTTVFVGV